ncbi:MAG: flagellar export chaperone FliS [Pirellulales bacterium]|nr:flagellar export chaperone FliS [Pirellulales bacterium]
MLERLTCDEYWTTQVLTATPQKLQLMLIDAALRHCRRAADDYAHGEFIAGGEPLLKAQEIFTEIMSAARQGADQNPLGRRIVGLYNFLFRQLVIAHVQHDAEKIATVMDILEIERETWQQLCEKLGTDTMGTATTDQLASSGYSFQA